MSESTAGLLERLRGQIRKLEAAPRTVLMALRCGVSELDDLGVFRLGAGVELTGEEASGRTTLALSVVASVCREKRLAAWVDGPHELFPPAALCLGVELERLLIVRPKEVGQLVWAAVQLLRSGAFTCVVLDVTHTGLVLSLTDTKKLLDAARAGGSLLVLVTAAHAPAAGLQRLSLRQVSPSSSAVRLASVDDAAVDEGPIFELSAAHGRHLRVPRARLSTSPPVPHRRTRHVFASPSLVRVAPSVSLQRPRKNFERDGYRHFSGAHGRPGREGPLNLPSRNWK